MNVNLGILDKLTKVAVFLIFVAGLIGVFYWYLPLIQQSQRYRREIISLDAKIAYEERLAKQTRASIDSLQNDPKAIERLAREKLSLAKTNEMVVRFEQPARR
jgi:cell division protein FtsB